MSSMFDSNVRDRRNHTEWAVMSFTAFMKDMAINANRDIGERTNPPVTLSCRYRPDVASRFWYSVHWTDERGHEHTAEAQELDLCLWRAAEMEIRARAKSDEPVEPM